jgi:hypothetical protein
MATTTTITLRETVEGGLARIRAGLGEVMELFYTVSNAHQCSLEAQRLMSLSDAELARHGLRRDEVVQHAFRRIMHQ